MSWLSRFSLAQRALIGLMSIVAIVFGAIAIPQLKQQLLPTIELPMVSVLAPYQGASPDVVEKQVVEPLEDNLKAVDGIKGVTSTASEGNAVIMASFDYGDDTKQLVADVQQAVNRARVQLPDDVDPQVVAGSTDDIPTVVLAVTSDKDQQALADQLDRTVVPALRGHRRRRPGHRQRCPGPPGLRHPRRQEAGGGRPQLRALAQALQAGGATVPAGSFSEAGKSRTVQVGGGFTSLQQIEDLMVPGAARHRRAASRSASATSPPSSRSRPTPISITRTNGKPSLAVMATMDKDGSAVAISDAVKDKLARPAQGPRRRRRAHRRLATRARRSPRPIYGLTTEGAPRSALRGHRHPGLPGVDPLDAGHRGLHPALRRPRPDRAVDPRPVAEHADAGRADHRDRPGRRRLDRGPGEHQAAPRLRRGAPGGDPHRGPGGGRRGHLLDPHHGRRLPADRPGRRHGRRAVRLVLA